MSKFVKLSKLQSLHRHYATGEILCRQGDLDRDLFILVHGKLRVLRDEREVAQIAERGAFVGEMTFLLGVPRSATVTAMESSEMIRVPAASVEAFFDKAPELAMRLATLLARRLLDTTSALSQEQARAERARRCFNELFGKVYGAWRTSRSSADAASFRFEFARSLDIWVEDLLGNEFLDDRTV